MNFKGFFLLINKSDHDDNNYENDFDESDDGDLFTVDIHTSDLKSKSFEGTDANVFISFLDEEQESDKVWLNKKMLTNKQNERKDLFEAGQVDQFIVQTNRRLNGRLKKIRIGHDNAGRASGWHLNEVVVTHKSTGKTYVFVCDRWLAKSEDDGEIERLLVALDSDDAVKQQEKQVNGKKLKISVKHQQLESDSDIHSASPKNGEK